MKTPVGAYVQPVPQSAWVVLPASMPPLLSVHVPELSAHVVAVVAPVGVATVALVAQVPLLAEHSASVPAQFCGVRVAVAPSPSHVAVNLQHDDGSQTCCHKDRLLRSVDPQKCNSSHILFR